MSINILGISAFYHDSVAALIRDGEIVAAAQEERFTRKKGDPRFPSNAIARVKPSKNLTLAGFVASLQNLTEVVSHLSFHVLLLAL